MQQKNIPAKAIRVFTGDTTLDDIGDDAQIMIKDGNLTVNGAVGQNVQIKLIKKVVTIYL